MNDPTLMPVTIVLLVLVSIAVFQRLYKLVGILVFSYFVYIGYIYSTSDKQPESIEYEVNIHEEKLMIPNEKNSKMVVRQTGIKNETLDEIDTVATVEYDLIVEPETSVPRLKLNTISISKNVDVDNRSPVDSDSIFPDDIGRLFCLTGINNRYGGVQTITHYWKYEGRSLVQVPIEIDRSVNWRCWSSVGIHPNWIGRWEVVVLDSNGLEFGSTTFQIVEKDSI